MRKVGTQFGPAGDDATLHGGIVGEPRAMAGRDLSFLGHTDNVMWLPKRGATISQRPGLAPRL
jgi:hypothetical protein